MPVLQALHEKIDEIPEAFRELYTEKNGKFELTGIAGVKTQADIDRLHSALEKERGDHKGTKDKFAVWGDLNYDDVVQKLDKYPLLEAAAAGKFDESKVEELAQKRAEAMTNSKVAPLDRENKQLKTTVAEVMAENQALKTEKVNRAIGDDVRAAMLASKVLPEAQDDALLWAERIFEIVDGKVVTKDGVGVLPGMSAKLWLESVAEKKPHWWPNSQGGGGGGSGNGSGGGPNNPWSAAAWNITNQAKYIEQHGIDRATQMAKLAGTVPIGGKKPAK
jgi:hypothetical protein